MSEPQTPESNRARRAVRRLLDAVDRALAAAQEVARARAALARQARRPPLRVAPEPEDKTDAD